MESEECISIVLSLAISLKQDFSSQSLKDLSFETLETLHYLFPGSYICKVFRNLTVAMSLAALEGLLEEMYGD